MGWECTVKALHMDKQHRNRNIDRNGELHGQNCIHQSEITGGGGA